MKKSRHFRHIDYFQIREGIKNSWKFATGPLAQSQAWMALSFPKNRYTAKNQHYSNLEFFNRIGRLQLYAATRFDMPLLTRKQSFIGSTWVQNCRNCKRQHITIIAIEKPSIGGWGGGASASKQPSRFSHTGCAQAYKNDFSTWLFTYDQSRLHTNTNLWPEYDFRIYRLEPMTKPMTKCFWRTVAYSRQLPINDIKHWI